MYCNVVVGTCGLNFLFYNPLQFFHVILHDSITHFIQFFTMTFKFHHEQQHTTCLMKCLTEIENLCSLFFFLCETFEFYQ
ncbi:hypothetical protein Hanom_Chr05g00466961 [Helianthus anomalus]